VCCNAFRYGQCNTQIGCSGGVHCRVVSCLPPYQWGNCTTTSLQDNRTSEHSSPYLPQWGPIAAKYKALGVLGSFLLASKGPVSSVGDGRGTYVVYVGGSIYHTSATGARAVPNGVKAIWADVGGPKGILGYPTSDLVKGRPQAGAIQLFEKGAIADSANTTTKIVYGEAYSQWTGTGRESGHLGYPVTNRISGLRDSGWRQDFQNGVVIDSASTSTKSVYGDAYTVWVSTGREGGTLGYPKGNRVSGLRDGGWLQDFQRGRVCGSAQTPTLAVAGVMNAAWQASGREAGQLRYPTAAVATDSRGSHQVFQGGELWALGSGAARIVFGAVLEEWQREGGAEGRYGYPVSDTVAEGNRLTCVFEGGTITA
jgi:uncharacterized protein with LGFP repeats